MADNNLIVGAVTDVGTTQYNPLGLLYTEPAGFGSDREPATTGTQNYDYGQRVWIYVYNDSGAALAQGSVCVRKAGTTTYRVRKSTQAAPQGPSAVVGVAQHAIANGEYGWILRTGIGEVIADTGGITADQYLVVGNAVDGTADSTATATTFTFGYATESVLATALATCWLHCVG